jgi:hypothetical protein
MAIAGFTLGYISIPLSLLMVAFTLNSFLGYSSAMSLVHQDYERTSSKNNLIQIGLAFKTWAVDHDGQFPFNVSQAQGGTRELCDRDSDGFERNPVPHFIVMSNELETPGILVCTDDKTKQAAPDFASLTAKNISYRLRSGTKVSDDNPEEILVVDSMHGLVLHCDGSVKDVQYDGAGYNSRHKTAAPNQ